jgi:ClpP class serine protease
MQPGDRITGVGSISVMTLADVEAALEAAKARDDEAVIVYVESPMGGRRHVSVRLIKAP